MNLYWTNRKWVLHRYRTHTARPLVLSVWLFSFFLLSFSCINLNYAYGQQATQSAELSADVKQVLSIAETEHEMARLLIKQGQYERVMPEMKKIFQLDLPIRYEGAVAESASLISEMLVEKKQFSIAHQILEEALQKMKKKENQAALWKIQAFVYKSEGDLESALKCLQQAIDLEKQIGR
jgi:tetratricopeptide (TPR) repeat protein